MTKIFMRLLLAAGLLFAGLIAFAAPASAQATRTWVSGVGDDVNPCSRTAPCKTFAGAISKTAAGGEINCLDQGAYGAVTITKSIALVCEGVTAGVLHSATNGIVINAAATDVIYLKGLDINGGTPSAAGLNGVRFLNGGALTIENCIIRNSVGAAPNGNGIAFQPAGAAKLVVKNTRINNHGSAGAGAGILIQPTGTGSAQVTLTNVGVTGNAGTGVRADTTGNTGANGITLQIVDSELSANSIGLFLFQPGGNTVPIKSMIVSSTLSNNSAAGLIANGSNSASAVFSDTTITANANGVVISGATVQSFGDNRLFGNAGGNAFPLTISKN